MGWLIEIFTWWNGNTVGTRFFTWRKGVKVGEDEAGNIYYSERSGPRRWVIYNGYADASRVPPEWHHWLHHTTDTPPSEIEYRPHAWEKPHQPNMTGTPQAWRPAGSMLKAGTRPRVTGDYDAWTPN
ncbi:NADH:ubiquinone oxidoreductase 17.2 kD subunit [hydrothermal vent metagenome]|uniref:NADH:ubiquinone oxidoreductase 17.2 kD subunit n=1 Tax=hydrothermal vent metagenome TaxID=652676 RepID=A0A3B0TGV1_9ZZZZ